MNNAYYLLIVVSLSALGLAVLWLRNRPKSSPKSSVEQFNDKMRALAPDDESRPRRGGHRTKAG